MSDADRMNIFFFIKVFKAMARALFAPRFSVSSKFKGAFCVCIFAIWRIVMWIYALLLTITPSSFTQCLSNVFHTKFSIYNDEYYLITLPYSHYCEKARWLLDECGIKYVEEGWAPFFVLITMFYSTNHSKTVPKLIVPHKHTIKHGQNVLMDSNEISLFCHLKNTELHLFGMNDEQFEEIMELQKFLDVHFGKQAFCIAYYYLYKDPQGTELLIDAQSKGLKWRRLQSASKCLWGYASQFVLWNLAMRFDDAKRLEMYHKNVDDTFDRIGQLLSEDNRRYLIKDCPSITVADVSFVSLALPLLLPDSWTNSRFISFDDASLPADYKQEVIAKRKTIAGQYALRVWREHRDVVDRHNSRT